MPSGALRGAPRTRIGEAGGAAVAAERSRVASPAMSYAAADGRQRILGDLAAAIDQVALALACLAEAYERLDEHSAERLEETLFRPAQAALGRAQRTYTAFVERHGLAPRAFGAGDVGHGNQAARDLVLRAADSAAAADAVLAELQDSMLPVEVGDPELRAGLAQVREQISRVPPAARAFLRTLGR